MALEKEYMYKVMESKKVLSDFNRKYTEKQ